MKGTYDKIIILYSLQQRSYCTTSATFQGVEYATYRTYFWMLLSGNVMENDCICPNWNKRNSRGNLLKTNNQVSTFYSWTNSRKYCPIWGMRRKIFKRIPQAARTYLLYETMYLFVTIHVYVLTILWTKNPDFFPI